VPTQFKSDVDVRLVDAVWCLSKGVLLCEYSRDLVAHNVMVLDFTSVAFRKAPCAYVLQDLMQHLSPRVCTILGSQARLYINEHDWAGSTFRWFDLCKCYNEVVDGLD
jgi:hypothetical protein